MAFRKIIVVLSGGGSTGLVKLSGSFDGLNKVKCECRCDAAGADARLFIIADDVTEIHVENAKTTFEVPISAKSDVYCLLYTGGKTLVGSSGGRADRRQLESRIDLYRRERARAAHFPRSICGRERRASDERPFGSSVFAARRKRRIFAVRTARRRRIRRHEFLSGGEAAD